MRQSRGQRLNWTEIDYVILDMDGTLLDLHFDNQVWNELLPRRYGELHRLAERQARAQVQDRLHERRGTLLWYCLDHWSREFGLDMSALEGELETLIDLRAGAQTFLGWLNGRGVRPLLATNAHPNSLARKLTRTGITQYFADIVSAHALGATKETADFWRALSQRYPFIPARTLLVDDNHAVLRAASAWGIAHLFGIARPDSRGQPVPPAEFPCIEDFAELIESAR